LCGRWRGGIQSIATGSQANGLQNLVKARRPR
jgi:hypothetical protein